MTPMWKVPSKMHCDGFAGARPCRNPVSPRCFGCGSRATSTMPSVTQPNARVSPEPSGYGRYWLEPPEAVRRNTPAEKMSRSPRVRQVNADAPTLCAEAYVDVRTEPGGDWWNR